MGLVEKFFSTLGVACGKLGTIEPKNVSRFTVAATSVALQTGYTCAGVHSASFDTFFT